MKEMKGMKGKGKKEGEGAHLATHRFATAVGLVTMKAVVIVVVVVLMPYNGRRGHGRWCSEGAVARWAALVRGCDWCEVAVVGVVEGGPGVFGAGRGGGGGGGRGREVG
jgi:hypothetical protein